jgi:hypothetical protein
MSPATNKTYTDLHVKCPMLKWNKWFFLIWLTPTPLALLTTTNVSVNPCSSRTRLHVSFRSPDLFYLLTVGVEVVHIHSITLRHTPQSVGLLWTRDRPVAETSTRQHKHSQETNLHATCGKRTHDPSKRLAADLCLRQRGHWDRPRLHVPAIKG